MIETLMTAVTLTQNINMRQREPVFALQVAVQAGTGSLVHTT